MAIPRQRRNASEKPAIQLSALLGLQKMDLFKGLDTTSLREIAGQCKWTRCKRNQYVLRRDGTDRDVYCVIAGMVDLEVTESLLMEDVEESIAPDDFGTGHSSLAYLSRLPIDTAKIDRSFVRSMTENADATSIGATIISLAKSLRHKVVAEGVETEEQAQLRAEG